MKYFQNFGMKEFFWGALQRNFIKITLRHGCSPINLLHIFRTLFPRNTSARLLLTSKLVVIQNNRNSQKMIFFSCSYIVRCKNNNNIKDNTHGFWFAFVILLNQSSLTQYKRSVSGVLFHAEWTSWYDNHSFWIFLFSLLCYWNFLQRLSNLLCLRLSLAQVLKVTNVNTFSKDCMTNTIWSRKHLSNVHKK